MDKEIRLKSQLDCVLTLCGKDGLEFGGQTYVPDGTSLYFTFDVSRSLPMVTEAGQSLFPSVIGRSYQSLRNKKIDFDHAIASFHPGKNISDRIIGAILDVQYPNAPSDGWRVQRDIDKAPGIHGLGVVWKEASGVAESFGKHLGGVKTLTVSMECLWDLHVSGFCIALAGGKPVLGKDTTPADVIAADWEYVPYVSAPSELKACYSTQSNRIVRTWHGRKVAIMIGGVTGTVLYAGLGIVGFGAEHTAKITRVLASSKEAALEGALASLSSAFVNRMASKNGAYEHN
jgi:hypothetical protein